MKVAEGAGSIHGQLQCKREQQIEWIQLKHIKIINNGIPNG